MAGGAVGVVHMAAHHSVALRTPIPPASDVATSRLVQGQLAIPCTAGCTPANFRVTAAHSHASALSRGDCADRNGVRLVGYMYPSIRSVAPLVWALLAPAFAHAQSQPSVDCRKAFSTPDIGVCAQRDFDAADARLNGAYQTLQASIDKSDIPADAKADWRKALVEAQRRWIAFRDAECIVTGFEWYGGSGRSAAELSCKTGLTDARTKQLRAHTDPK